MSPDETNPTTPQPESLPINKETLNDLDVAPIEGSGVRGGGEIGFLTRSCVAEVGVTASCQIVSGAGQVGSLPSPTQLGCTGGLR